MPETKRLVINTGPLLALTAATGDLALLRELYDEVVVPREVADEIRAGGPKAFGLRQFEEATWLSLNSDYVTVSAYLINTLDQGEAAVIQLALDKGILVVCIDEIVGRRVALLNNLELTGSLGVLLRASKQGLLPDLNAAIDNMRRAGIWIGPKVLAAAFELNSSE